MSSIKILDIIKHLLNLTDGRRLSSVESAHRRGTNSGRADYTLKFLRVEVPEDDTNTDAGFADMGDFETRSQ